MRTTVPLHSLCNLVNGRAFKQSEWGEDGLPIIRIQNLNDETKGFNYYSGPYDRKHEVNPGDLLFSWSGTPGSSFGAFFWRRTKGLLNQHIFNVVADESKVFKPYLRYALNHLLDDIIDCAHGAVGLQHITKSQLNNILIPLPSLPEQKRIAAILDAADNVRMTRQESIELLDSLVQATFMQMFGDPVRNPKGWDQCPFGELGDCRLGKMLDRGKQRGDGDYPYLANRNVKWGAFDLTELPEMSFSAQDRQEFRLAKGDLLICEGGEVGRTAIWREEREGVYFQKALHRLRLYPHKAVPEYVQYYMWFMAVGGGFRDYTSSATIAHLTGVKLKTLPCPLPPIALQSRFAAVVEAVESHKVRLKSQYAELATLFASLQSRAFSGELSSSSPSRQHASA